MKKIILSAVVLAAAVSANAQGSSEQSLNNSSTISGGILGSIETTVSSVVDGVVYSGKAIGNASLYILEKPEEASAISSNAVSGAVKYVVSTVGDIITISGEVIVDPSGQTTTVAMGRMTARFNASGELSTDTSTETKKFLTKKYGPNLKLVTDGAGGLLTLGKGSVVASADVIKASGQDSSEVAKASVKVTGQSSEASAEAQDVVALVRILLDYPSNVVDASVEGAKRNNKK